jgi:hypothetical protein
MRALRIGLAVLSLLSSLALGAQQLDIYDPDDFVDPHRLRGRAIFISRLVAGVSRGYLDQYRPARQDVRFVHLANSLYWSGFQFDYKHAEVRGQNGSPPKDEPCCCGSMLSVALDCRPVHSDVAGTPASAPAPAPGTKDLLQFSWYQTAGSRVSIRYRLVRARQYALPETAAHVPGLEDHDDTSSAQIDVGVRTGARTLFAAIGYTELTRHSTLDGGKQKTLTLAVFLPLMRVGPAVLIPRIQIGRITGAGPAHGVVNPSLDLSWTIPHTDASLHLIYSPAFGNLGTETRVNHQVAIYADRALLAIPLGRRR